ncbi:MAG: hypothetical protein ACI4JB_11125 [Porcipelethomonas sp.]
MDITSELIQNVRNAESPEQLLEIARANDANISLADAQMIFSAMQEGTLKTDS